MASVLVDVNIWCFGIIEFKHFHLQNVDSDAMTYTSVSFHPKAKIKRPEPPRELQSNVVYAATR